MVLGIIILIALLVPVVLIIREIKREGFTKKTITVLIISILVFSGTLVLYIDGSRLKQHFENAPKTFLLDNHGTIIAGIQELRTETTYEIKYLAQAELNELDLFYKQGNLEKMKGTSDKLLIFAKDYLNVEETRFVDSKPFFRSEVDELFASEKAIDYYAEALRYKTVYDTEPAPIVEVELLVHERLVDEVKKKLLIEDHAQLKGMFFATLLMKKVSENDENMLLVVLDALQKEKAVLYQENLVVTVGKKLPQPLIVFFLTDRYEQAYKKKMEIENKP